MPGTNENVYCAVPKTLRSLDDGPLRVFPVLVSQEFSEEPLRVPICVFEADEITGRLRAQRQAESFYGDRILRWVE